ncbi:MAG: HAD family hydrolase [Chloroflexota bacterium]|nr:HAD family hydrolase [Anaerolineales bacterium]
MISSTGPKAVFFDLDGTLRHSVPSGADVFTDYAATLGLQVDRESRLRAIRWEHLYWASSVDLRDDLLAHSDDTENFWIQYSQRRLLALGASSEWAVEFAPNVSKHMGEFYKPESIIPDDVRRTLPQLKQAGYILGVISNRDHPFQDLLNEHGIGEFFDFSLAAGEVNTFKPEPGVFEHGLQRVNLAAQDVVYVGDNYYADVVGARRAGLQPVLYDPLGVFPEPDCTTIKSFDELVSAIKVIE